MDKALNLRILENFEIEFEWDNGKKRILDIKPYRRGAVFAPLFEDTELFKTVRIDRIGGIEWDNGACLSPETVLLASRAVK
jgi:hypothetical protein